jgi:hypothetical protein
LPSIKKTKIQQKLKKMGGLKGDKGFKKSKNNTIFANN